MIVTTRDLDQENTKNREGISVGVVGSPCLGLLWIPRRSLTGNFSCTYRYGSGENWHVFRNCSCMGDFSLHIFNYNKHFKLTNCFSKCSHFFKFSTSISSRFLAR